MSDDRATLPPTTICPECLEASWVGLEQHEASCPCGNGKEPEDLDPPPHDRYTGRGPGLTDTGDPDGLPWVFVHVDGTGTVACDRCKAKEQITSLPTTVAKWCSFVVDFESRHAECKPREKR